MLKESSNTAANMQLHCDLWRKFFDDVLDTVESHERQHRTVRFRVLVVSFSAREAVSDFCSKPPVAIEDGLRRRHIVVCDVWILVVSFSARWTVSDMCSSAMLALGPLKSRRCL